MTKKELIHIITVFDEETVLSAANKLNISQPSLSQSIIKIEKNLGTNLFLRNGKHIVPTQVCKAIVEKGRATLEKWNYFENDIASIVNASKSEITIGLPSGLCRVFYYPYLEKEMKKNFPEIKLNLIEERSDKVEQMILSGNLDLGIIHSPLNNPNISSIPIYKSTNLLAVSKSNPFYESHPYKNLDYLTTVKLSEIKDAQFAIIQHHKEDFLLAEEFNESGFKPTNIVKKTSVWNNFI